MNLLLNVWFKNAWLEQHGNIQPRGFLNTWKLSLAVEQELSCAIILSTTSHLHYPIPWQWNNDIPILPGLLTYLNAFSTEQVT